MTTSDINYNRTSIENLAKDITERRPFARSNWEKGVRIKNRENLVDWVIRSLQSEGHVNMGEMVRECHFQMVRANTKTKLETAKEEMLSTLRKAWKMC